MENPLSSCSSSGRRKRIKKKAAAFIVDDIIIDILSRIPAKYVLLCRCVCRRWRDLTSTRDFTDLHSRRSFPMILKDQDGRRTLVDRCWEPSRRRSKIHKLYEPHDPLPLHEEDIHFSQNGLIVAPAAASPKDIVIYNPIYHDFVHIMAPLNSFQTSEIYGIYFNPIQDEFCTLWRITSSFNPLEVQFKILNLGSNPKWRVIRSPCTQIPWIWHISLSTKKYIYWMVEPSYYHHDIMEFDIENEEFRFIPGPVPVNVNWFYRKWSMIDIDGAVSFVQTFPSKEYVNVYIWTLKDEGEKTWTSSSYIVSLDVYPKHGVLTAVVFWNGELVLASDGRLYFCNLKLGTYRKFGQNYRNIDVKFLPHVTSLVSLKNCNSYICLDEEDGINDSERGRGEEIQALR